MIHWLLGLSILYVSLCVGSGVGPRLRADRGGEAPPTTNYVTGDSDEETWPLNNVETISDPTLGVRADVALLEELRTITELILRNQREGESVMYRFVHSCTERIVESCYCFVVGDLLSICIPNINENVKPSICRVMIKFCEFGVMSEWLLLVSTYAIRLTKW